jgi:hypothetical protein
MITLSKKAVAKVVEVSVPITGVMVLLIGSPLILE